MELALRKMGKLRKYIAPLALGGILIMTMLIVNNILFLHIQPLPDGTYVLHAHPYNKKDNPPVHHHHNDTEILLLNSIALFYFLKLILFVFITPVLRNKRNRFSLMQYTGIFFSDRPGRSPPQIHSFQDFLFLSKY